MSQLYQSCPECGADGDNVMLVRPPGVRPPSLVWVAMCGGCYATSARGTVREATQAWNDWANDNKEGQLKS